MKTTVTLLILLTLFSLNTFAQDSRQSSLPEGAKVRFGKGRIIKYGIRRMGLGSRLLAPSAFGSMIRRLIKRLPYLRGIRLGSVASHSALMEPRSQVGVGTTRCACGMC